jgi:hypothetical protein
MDYLNPTQWRNIPHHKLTIEMIRHFVTTTKLYNDVDPYNHFYQNISNARHIVMIDYGNVKECISLNERYCYIKMCSLIKSTGIACNLPLLRVSYILAFWTQFGRDGAAGGVRTFKGITSSKISAILYIIMCVTIFNNNSELTVHYNAMFNDILFTRLLPNMWFQYFFQPNQIYIIDVTVLDQTKFHDIVRGCNILPVGLYDITHRVIKHYFLIVKFSESDYSIISAYGNERIQVELTEKPITLGILLEFINSVNIGNIEYVRNFILHYFLNDNQTYRDEVLSYVGQLEMYYFHNLVGQIKEVLNIRTGGGYKKRKCMSLTNKRRRKYRYSTRHRPSAKRTTRHTRRTTRRR